MMEVGKNGVVSIQVWYMSEEEYSFSEVMNMEEAKKEIAYYEARGCTCEVRVWTEEDMRDTVERYCKKSKKSKKA